MGDILRTKVIESINALNRESSEVLINSFVFDDFYLDFVS